MARKPAEAAAKYNAIPNGMDTLNAIRANSSSQYQERIPVATQDNLKEIGNILFTYDALRKEFLNGLVGRIARTLITNRMYRNPLAPLKSMMLEFGETVEEIFVDLIKGQDFNPGRAETNLLRRNLPDVHVTFHTRNSQRQYKFTISDVELRTAFLSYEGIESLIGKIVDAAYSSDNFDEFLIMKQMIAQAANNGALGILEVPAVTDEASGKQVMIALRELSYSLTFMNTNYNFAGVNTYSDISSQIFLTTPKIEATLGVEVLAYAFNLSQADYLARRIMVDNIDIPNCIGVIMDVAWFKVFDNFINFTEVYNAEGLYWNYFLNHWSTFSYSPFDNAVALVTETTEPTALTIAPATVTSAPDTFVQFTPTWTGTGVFNKAIDYTVTGALSAETSITFNGQLYIGPDETAPTLTVTATSRVYDLSATATVTVG